MDRAVILLGLFVLATVLLLGRIHTRLPRRRPRRRRGTTATTTTTTRGDDDHRPPATTTTSPPKASRPPRPVLVVNASGCRGRRPHHQPAPGGRVQRQAPIDATANVSTSAVYYVAGTEGGGRSGGRHAPPAGVLGAAVHDGRPGRPRSAPPTSSSWSPPTWRPPSRSTTTTTPADGHLIRTRWPTDPGRGAPRRGAGPARPRWWRTRPGRRCCATSTARWPPSWTNRPRPGPLDGAPTLLGRLAGRFGTVAVVSGRPAAFLADRMSGLDRTRAAGAAGRADRSLRHGGGGAGRDGATRRAGGAVAAGGRRDGGPAAGGRTRRGAGRGEGAGRRRALARRLRTPGRGRRPGRPRRRPAAGSWPIPGACPSSCGRRWPSTRGRWSAG